MSHFIGIMLLVLSIFSLTFMRRTYLYLLIYLEIGVLGIVLLFASLSLIYCDPTIQVFILIFLCMGAIESIMGVVLILVYLKKAHLVLKKCI